MATIRRLSSFIRSRRDLASERADHDLAMSDPRIALEHDLAIARAVARGESGCKFCG
jgi:hypothetical protein